VATACIKQKWIAKAAATFFWAAVPYRTTWRYSERGWRYIFLDAGHICQNLYLACEAVAAGCCAVDAFDDDALNQLLGLDGKERFVLYAAPVGHK
jgi:SagB-type dehydrogenase family enzyme